MQSRDFCFWLQGFFELNKDARTISAEQAVIIKRHLDLVFAHEIGPSVRGRPKPEPVEPSPPPEPAPPEPLPRGRKPNTDIPQDERAPIVPMPTPRC